MKIRFIGMISLALACLGCATRVSNQSLAGAWHFAYAIEAMAPPKFDKLEFADTGVALFASSIEQQSIPVRYSVLRNKLHCVIQPEGPAKPIERDWDARLRNGGSALVLSEPRAKFAYLRPDQFLNDDLAGTWMLSDAEDRMRLGPDGSYKSSDGRAVGYYRLWKSGRGPAMTLVLNVPGEGTFAVYFLYQLRDGELELKPLQQGLRPGASAPPAVWRRVE